MFDVGCFRRSRRSEKGSVLIIVLWVCIGLVSIALYFANSMTYELRAADNRVSGIAADQAIEGAARYVGYVLQNFATNGAMPDLTQYTAAGLAIGDAHVWLIGRDPTGENSSEPYFSLIDEASKLNLNTANTNTLSYLPNMTYDFAQAILDWRGTNGQVSLDYTSLGYLPKNAPFETVDELRLVYGADVGFLAGEDVNRNGVLDASEKDLNANGELDPGLLGYVTVYTREPNFHSDGGSLTNVNTIRNQTGFLTLFQNDGVSSPSSRAEAIFLYTHPRGNTTPQNQVRTFTSILDFAVRCRSAGMSADDYAKISADVTISTNSYFRGRVNINTASGDVLTALFEGLTNDEQTSIAATQSLLNYREQNPNNLGSIVWIYDALGNNNAVLTALRRGDYITTRSFQFTADIAAVGAYGRGYRRVKFIFDISDGTPKILYRQDLSRLGWAIGEKARQTLVANNTQ